MKRILNNLKHSVWFFIFSITSILLLIASFIVPPTGIIDDSVLKGVAELFAFGTLDTVRRAIEKGLDAKITHNNTTLQIGDIKENTTDCCNSIDGELQKY